MPWQLFGNGRNDWSAKLIRGLSAEAAAGFQSRRGRWREPTPVNHHYAAFATYKAARVREKRMPKTQIVSPKIPQPSGHFSQATMIEARGRFVFISGMTARRADGTIAGIGDIETQTRQVCENVKAAVEQAGGTMDDICRVDVFVRNMEHFDQIHKVRREYFRSPAPASTMVEVCKMTSPDYLIEINAIAVIGE